MKITFLTLFPEMFVGPLSNSIMKRATQKDKAEFTFVNIRQFGQGRHQIVDDTPYGGGIGMVLKVNVVHEAIKHALNLYPLIPRDQTKIVLTSASGSVYNQTIAKTYTAYQHIIIICGHYEGVDARINKYIDDEISIGDFVLTGGEIPAMLIADSVVRLLPGVITDGATEDESFSQASGMLEYPHFTKPREYDGEAVPEVLVTGDHKKIAAWRQDQALEKTQKVRPELVKKK